MSAPLFYKETARLILRAPKAGDAEILAAKRSTPFVLRYNLYRPCDAAQITREFELYEHIVLAEKEGGKVIGCVSVREDHLRYGVNSCSLQAWLAEEEANRGYMTEALDAVLFYLLEGGIAERVAAYVFADNHASLRLCEKLGFVREGCLAQAVKNQNGQVFDLVLLSIDRETYEKRKSTGGRENV